MITARSETVVTPLSPQPKRLPGSRRMWFVLAVCAVLVGVLAAVGYQHWQNRGTRITVHFQDAHGLRVGADVRYRGVSVGRVTEVMLQPGESGAEVHATLNPGSESLARAGCQFWVVRPTVSLAAGLNGLDTVAGDNYLALGPSKDGGPAVEFIGHEDAPLPEVAPGSLSVILKSRRKTFGLRPGATVTCCGMPIGLVRKVDLAKDGRGVQVALSIEAEHAGLVYKNTTVVEREVVSIGKPVPVPQIDLQALVGGIELKVPENPEQRPTGWQPEFEIH